jgi:hypothetical protein
MTPRRGPLRVTTSFQAQAAQVCYSPDSRHIAASHRSATNRVTKGDSPSAPPPSLGTNLSGANLLLANLSGAFLVANLSGANLLLANLSGAELTGATQRR